MTTIGKNFSDEKLQMNACRILPKASAFISVRFSPYSSAAMELSFCTQREEIMKFETYPLRFRFFHSDIKRGNLTAFILSSMRHMTMNFSNEAC